MSDRRLTPADLSPDQREVFEQIMAWVEGRASSKPLLTMGGLGGVGKSTLVGVLASSWKLHVAFCCFTGRASSVLERKLKACGVKTTSLPFAPPERVERSRFAHLFSPDPSATYCGTIHRLLYKPIINAKDELIGFKKRDQLDRDYDLICVDEASMVGSEILADLQAHDVPILAVGDHGQLPPVRDSGVLMENPDLRLEKIHRQAQGSPIIQLAHFIREGGRFSNWKGWGGDVRKGSKRDVDAILGESWEPGLSSGLLCWTNRNRVWLNSRARAAAGRKGPPSEGEVVICLKNEPPVYNGMRGLLRSDAKLDAKRDWLLNARIEFPDEGLVASHFQMFAGQFMKERTFATVESVREAFGLELERSGDIGGLYDFGHALTVHKSQGSQFENVIVYADMPEGHPEYSRFFYTAATRSSRNLWILT